MTQQNTAVITGASGGIGLELARLHAQKGGDVVLVARSEGKLNALKAELERSEGVKAYVIAEDLSDPKAADRIYAKTEELGLAIDVLINNAAMWDFFSEGLNKRLAELDSEASTKERVRALLLETLPNGDCTIDEAASKLGMGKRTLQRKLSVEGESFQTVLKAVRMDLADLYLQKSSITLGEISFLLGFQEPNSFIRAYSSWKGMSPGQYRQSVH